jgi:pyrroloquinoline quinone biosynthesis protein B
VASDGRRFLIDATPDLPRQITGFPAIDGLVLTHGHMGHVAGLLWFGREAMATREVPVWLGERLESFLTTNEPWASLFREGHLVARRLRDGEPVPLGADLTIAPLPVPHRDEWSETYAVRVEGPRRSLLWLPDIDRFGEEELSSLLADVDLAFLDGTFWSPEELPGRDLDEIPHPLVGDTVDLLIRIRPACEVCFVHLNHTNPLWDADSEATRLLRAALEAAGVASPGGSPVAEEGGVFEL